MEVINLICFDCKHYGIDNFGCAAFPEGIPNIIQERNKHDNPLSTQDNNIVFEQINNEKPF
jgi:hypothetical protein